jgi:hypothetical protein
MTKSFRLRFTFWLDLSKDEEFRLSEQIEELKAKRSFAKVIRDGIRLICDLRAGRTDILLELFPWVAERFQPQADTSELAALVEQFKQAMTMPAVAGPPRVPAFDPTPKVGVIDESKARELSINNALAALEDF